MRQTAPILSRSKTGLAGDLLVFRASGGVRVFVDQSAQDRFPADLLCVYAGHGGARSVRFAVGDALGDALVRPGRVVAAPRGAVLYRPRSGQGREEMSLDPMPNPAPKG
jgi:hypothetical protein